MPVVSCHFTQSYSSYDNMNEIEKWSVMGKNIFILYSRNWGIINKYINILINTFYGIYFPPSLLQTTPAYYNWWKKSCLKYICWLPGWPFFTIFDEIILTTHVKNFCVGICDHSKIQLWHSIHSITYETRRHDSE